MDGILLIDKPKGWTSFDVVAKTRGIIKKETGEKIKVGHTGTLDPLATGLLVIVIGSYCKRAQEFSKLDKTYEVEMRLGAISTTGDAEGKITPAPQPQLSKFRRPSKNFMQTQGVAEKFIGENFFLGLAQDKPSFAGVKKTLKSFIGESLQVPPAYSAVKVGGQRAYKLARAGKAVKLEPRKVTVYGLKVTDYSYPEVKFTADVSSGTYIRSLVEDIGKKLGTGAYMNGLRRDKIGHFSIAKGLPANDLTLELIKENILQA